MLDDDDGKTEFLWGQNFFGNTAVIHMIKTNTDRLTSFWNFSSLGLLDSVFIHCIVVVRRLFQTNIFFLYAKIIFKKKSFGSVLVGSRCVYVSFVENTTLASLLWFLVIFDNDFFSRILSFGFFFVQCKQTFFFPYISLR